MIISVPANYIDFQGRKKVYCPQLVFQDTPHLVNKLRNRVVNKNLQLGPGLISLDVLRNLDINSNPLIENNLGIRAQDLKPDRMDFKASQRLVGDQVMAFLQKVAQQEQDEQRSNCDAKYLYAYMKVVRCVLFSFMHPEVPALNRIHLAWYARYFCEGWKRSGTQKEKFITSNCYTSIIINAESLLLYVSWIISDPELHHTIRFAPWLFGSQQNEHIFRATRKNGEYENYNFVEFLRRLALGQKHLELAHKHQGVFHFATHPKHYSLDDLSSPANLIPLSVTDSDIREVLEAARVEAISDLMNLGVLIPGCKSCKKLSTAVEGESDQEVEINENEFEQPDKELFTNAVLQALDLDLLVNPQEYESQEEECEDSNAPECKDGLEVAITATMVTSNQRQACFAPIRKPPQKIFPEFARAPYGLTKIPKRRACAIISGHPKSSKDRTRRVQGIING